ncbi:unnamed protein product [Meganyctiphanes norvegica]|uniref:Uncharacterized protein n=1 Tax=Meganyctiphanes norvegica TaxID=48144 RepID=A0AAV2Q6N0_MEGNR
MRDSLLLLLVTAFSPESVKLNRGHGIKCWRCSNVSRRSDYDRHCGRDNYYGSSVECNECTACYTYVFANGNIYRGPESMIIDEPRCLVYSTTTECYCLTNHCNSDHCKQCKVERGIKSIFDMLTRLLARFAMRG